MPGACCRVFYLKRVNRSGGSKPALRSAGSGDPEGKWFGKRSLTTEGIRHCVMRISRFAWRKKPQVLLESSALWKGELVHARCLREALGRNCLGNM
jgi:hypothetical protein